MGDDRHILDGSPVNVKFAGETYQFKQQPRRQQRVVRERLADIAATLGEINEVKGNTKKVPAVIRGVNQIMDFCEDHHQGMAENIDAIESQVQAGGLASMSELIESVFTPLFQAWVSPYLSDDVSQKKTTST